MAIIVSHRFSPGDDFPVETGHYRLVASGACPWCRRVLIARRLLGLIKAIPVSWNYGRGVDGYWELTGPDDELDVDPALGARLLTEIYEKTPGYTPPPTVPALVDATTGQVVSDDPSDLLFDPSTAWWDLHREGAPDLYPLGRRNSTDARGAWIGPQVNVGRAVAAHSQDPEKAAATASGVLVNFDVIGTLPVRATQMEASREGGLAMLGGPTLSAIVAIGQYLCDDRPTDSGIRLLTIVQSYEYDGRQHYPDGETPSISFWPVLARWFRALENRSDWVGSEEHSALSC